jgi:hypothetical protein
MDNACISGELPPYLKILQCRLIIGKMKGKDGDVKVDMDEIRTILHS